MKQKPAREKALAAVIQARDAAGLERQLASFDEIPARAVIEAARLAWKPGLVLLKKRGADLNASYRNYRALHALIQEKPHEGGSSTPKRVKVLEWLLANGADPELTGAWPAVRAIVVAAFTGEATYVDVLKTGGARMDGFAASALGNPKTVAASVQRDNGFAVARDRGGVTALHCCAGSRLGRASLKVERGLLDVARLLLDAGADPNATVRSWSHEVDVLYFAIGAHGRPMVELLLDRGADATAGLPSAVWGQHYDVAEVLISRGARIDEARDGKKPILNELIRWGQFKPASWLLANGASPNVPDERGWTAVHQAVSRGNVRMLKAVIEAGGDANRIATDGLAPRHLARLRRDLLELL